MSDPPTICAYLWVSGRTDILVCSILDIGGDYEP